MAMRDLIPWGRNRAVPAPQYGSDDAHPFLALHREMNRMFDDVFRSFDLPTATSRFGWSTGWPQVEVNETDKEVRVIAEVPGLDEKDIDVTLHEGVLTLSGEKKSESDGPVYSERWHGRFQRSMQLGPDVDPDKVSATFNNGVLTITFGKHPEAQSRVKRIPVNA
jgi:HSP20 family protein